jgi:hypothetical protein
VMGTVDGKAVGLGNQKLLEEMGVRPYGVVESRLNEMKLWRQAR